MSLGDKSPSSSHFRLQRSVGHMCSKVAQVHPKYNELCDVSNFAEDKPKKLQIERQLVA